MVQMYPASMTEGKLWMLWSFAERLHPMGYWCSPSPKPQSAMPLGGPRWKAATSGGGMTRPQPHARTTVEGEIAGSPAGKSTPCRARRWSMRWCLACRSCRHAPAARLMLH